MKTRNVVAAGLAVAYCGMCFLGWAMLPSPYNWKLSVAATAFTVGGMFITHFWELLLEDRK